MKRRLILIMSFDIEQFLKSSTSQTVTSFKDDPLEQWTLKSKKKSLNPKGLLVDP